MGFLQKTMDTRLSNINKYWATWRKVEQRTVVMTGLTQSWTHTSGEMEVKHICPWGMQDLMSKFYSRKICKNLPAVPNQVKIAFPKLFHKDVYQADEWAITMSNSGPQEPTKFYWLYFNHCQSVLVPTVLLEYGDKLGEEKTIDSLIANWDLLKIPSKYADYVGCFLPWDAEHHACPNAPKYIRDQASHPKTSHAYTVMVTSKKHQLKQAVVSTRPPEVLSLEAPTTSASNPKQLTQKQCYMKIDNFLSSIPLTGDCVKPMHQLAKGFCLSMVHTGVNKALSQNSIIENYNSGFEGMHTYYEHVSGFVRSNHPQVAIPPTKGDIGFL